MCFQHVALSRLFFYFNIFFSCIRSTLSSERTDEIYIDELILHGLNQIIIRSTNKDSWFQTFLVDLMTDWHEMITIYRFSFSSSSILIQEEMKIIQNWLWLYLSVPVWLGFAIPEKVSFELIDPLELKKMPSIISNEMSLRKCSALPADKDILSLLVYQWISRSWLDAQLAVND